MQHSENAMQQPGITVCVLADSETTDDLCRCLESIFANPPQMTYELRLVFQGAPACLHYAMGRTYANGQWIGHEHLPEGVERFDWTMTGDVLVRAWQVPKRMSKISANRLLYRDVPLHSDYAIRFDEDVVAEAGWWHALVPVLARKIDYIGHTCWTDYTVAQLEMIRSQPWFTGIPFARREQRAGGMFMSRFSAVRADRLLESSLSDSLDGWKVGRSSRFAADILLGEMARQLGWSQLHHDQFIHVPDAFDQPESK